MLAYNYTFVFENINLSSSVKIKTTDIIHPAFNWADLKAKNLQKKRKPLHHFFFFDGNNIPSY